MELTFIVNSDGIDFIKKHKMFFYPNVTYDKNKSTVIVELPEPDGNTFGQFMTVIKERGLLIGDKQGEPISLDSKNIIEYPHELEVF